MSNKSRLLAVFMITTMLFISAITVFAAPTQDPPNGNASPNFTSVTTNTIGAPYGEDLVVSDRLILDNQRIEFDANNIEGQGNSASLENTNGDQIRVLDDIDLGRDFDAAARSIYWGPNSSITGDSNGPIVSGRLRVNGDIQTGPYTDELGAEHFTRLNLTGDRLDTLGEHTEGGPVLLRLGTAGTSGQLVFGTSTRIKHVADRLGLPGGSSIPTTVFELPLVTNGKGIGSYEKRWVNFTVDSSTHTSNNATNFNTVTCKGGTQIVSCSGRISDPGAVDFHHMGTEVSYTSNGCRAYSKRVGAGSATQYIEAMCFDPTGYKTSVNGGTPGNVHVGDYLLGLIFGNNEEVYLP
jgi:hypothetical protein